MPSINLTVKTIAAIKPPIVGQVDYFDTNKKGFFLRVSAGERKVFGVMYRYQGRLRRMTLGTYPDLGLADARDAAGDALHAVAKGRDPANEKQQEKTAETFGELATEYLERHAKVFKRSWHKDELVIKRELLPRFKNTRAKDVTRREIIAMLEDIRKRAPIMANRTLEIVRKVFNWAVAVDILQATPCAKIPKPAPERKRRRTLSDDEIKAFWTATEPETWQMQTIFRLRLVLAQRGIEVATMKKADIEGRWWTVPPEIAKNGKPHRVYLSNLAFDMIEHAKELSGKSPWVFPSPRVNRKGEVGPITNLGKRAVVIRDRAKSDFKAHDLRRTASTRLTGELKIPRSILAKVINHTDKDAPKATEHYDIYEYSDEKEDALTRWGAHLSGILAGEKANVILLKKRA